MVRPRPRSAQEVVVARERARFEAALRAAHRERMGVLLRRAREARRRARRENRLLLDELCRLEAALAAK